jgi:hypothetical protein
VLLTAGIIAALLRLVLQQGAGEVAVSLGGMRGEPVEQQQFGTEGEVARVFLADAGFLFQFGKIFDEALVFLGMAFGEGVIVFAH